MTDEAASLALSNVRLTSKVKEFITWSLIMLTDDGLSVGVSEAVQIVTVS